MKTMTLPCHSGAYDCHTPPDAKKFLLPSVAEERQSLRQELHEKQARRAELKQNFEREYDWALSREYKFLGTRIKEVQDRISEIDKEFKRQTEESFETMFVRAAKNTLLPEEFNRLKKYAFQMLDEFREQTHLGESS
jgi:exonuclease VII large subunit